MKNPRAAGADSAIRRTGALLCVVAGVLLSGCEAIHPDIVKGYTVGEAERAAVAAQAEREVVAQPTGEVVTA